VPTAARDTPADHEASLRAHGLSVTAQRLAVLRAVSGVSHRTADGVYTVVRAELGSVSKQAVYDALATLTELEDADFLLARQTNFETIHRHDVVAERFGTAGELRGELRTGSPSTRQTTLAAWLAI